MFVALDNETGGLEQEHSLLTSHLLVLDDALNPIDSIDFKFRPDDGNYVVTAEALGVNRIDLTEHDSGASLMRECKTPLYDFLKKYSNSGASKLIPVGHNVKGDIESLQRNLLSRNTWLTFVSYRVLDTAGTAQFLKFVGLIPESVPGSLSSLAEYFEVPVKDVHTAKGDVEMTVGVLRAMKQLVTDARFG